MILSRNIVEQVAYNAGFRGNALDNSVEIAGCESGFDTNAYNLTNREDSRGLWQINIKANPQFASWDLFDPQINANAAYQLYKNRGDNFSDWTCAIMLNLVNPTTLSISTLAIVSILVLYLLSED